MLLKKYTLEIFKSKCQADAKGVHCFAHLEQDVSDTIPYLNTVLGGFEYLSDPPAVTFKAQGKLITVHGRKIAVNALKDEKEARKIVEWLKNEINTVWETKDDIEPCYTGMPRPGIIEILKLLPKTNCRECNEATCMVFATKIAEGAKGPEDCPRLGEDENKKLTEYMSQFNLDL
ncbi:MULTISPECIES: (Fe-S)-binding protein [Desulfobacula]|uniref:Predicted Fe-S cluster protein n=2 Tax=Desulfobacula TaxID=28222 RepID=K0NKM4_DESTT|nr:MULTISPECIES: (Fe-S)-binding protein [Desulfobacula]CCK82106.1 predicted Fe-S cluster protein [Desulfobacula toluolica Tol2]SDU46654.1 Metal-binding trascriptional regulator, contains putative Fe-S cluster and ArsR family DNA binding domain [Desulfobacula phenolica]